MGWASQLHFHHLSSVCLSISEAHFVVLRTHHQLSSETSSFHPTLKSSSTYIIFITESDNCFTTYSSLTAFIWSFQTSDGGSRQVWRFHEYGKYQNYKVHQTKPAFQCPIEKISIKWIIPSIPDPDSYVSFSKIFQLLGKQSLLVCQTARRCVGKFLLEIMMERWTNKMFQNIGTLLGI